MLMTILILAAVAAWVAFVVIRLIRQKKSGGCSCGCGSCPYASSCHSDAKEMAHK